MNDWICISNVHGVKEVCGGWGCSDNTCSLAYAVYYTLCRSDTLTVSACHCCLELIVLTWTLAVFTAERRLLQTSGVQQLKDTRLGIEGNYWLRKILGKDPAVTAMGGIPLKLKDTVEHEIKAFK